MFNKSFAILMLALLLVTIAAADTHLYLYPGSPPSEAQLKAWQVAVAGYSPDGVILVTNAVLGQRLQTSHPQMVDLGVWEEGTARFIIAAKDLTASIKPRYQATGWALVDDADALQRERIHGMALEHGRPFIPKERPAPAPQTKPSRYLPGLGAILNGITSGELMGWVNMLVGYQTRYSPTASGHQAAEDMADTLAGWGYDVTRWRYIYSDFNDIYRDGNDIWTCGVPVGNSGLATIFHSTNSGQTFNQVYLPDNDRALYCHRIAASGDHILLAATGVLEFSTSYQPGSYLFVSHDGGLTWTARNPAGNSVYNGIVMNQNQAWFVTQLGLLYHSTDFGDTWQQLAFPSVPTSCYDVAVSGNVIAVCGAFGIYISTDDGLNWNHTYHSVAHSVLRVRFYNNRIWAVGSNGLVLRSNNDFMQFETIYMGERSFHSIAFNSSSGIICGEAGALYKSIDSGNNWQEVSIDTESTLYAVEFTTIGTPLLGGSSGSIWGSDSGLTNWSSLIANFNPTDSAVWTNVIAEKQGATRPGEIILASAHLDSITWGEDYDPWTLTPGADDNATGTSTVLTLANAMRNLATERTLRFVLYTGEEEGLIGSSRYAFWSQAQGEDIQAVYNLDMTAYTPDAIKQDLIANQQSAWLSDYAVSCAHQYVPGYPANSITDPLFVYSDHSPFWGLGIPALCSIESWDVRGENPYYHSPQDLPEWLNAEQMLGACRVAGATIGELAQPGDSPLPDTLAELKVYPNPFRPGTGQQIMTFANVPVGSKVEVYDLAGNRVAHITYTDGYRITWEGKSSAGNRLATGVYLYKVSAPGNSVKTGKLAIIN